MLQPHLSTHSKYAGKGLSGIVNKGNTCYMNACLSVLSHTYELNDLLDNANLSARRKTLLNRKPNAVLLDEWDDLRKILWNQNCTVSPGRFVSAVQHVARETGTVAFQGWDQNDTSEFLLFIFDAFHNACARAVVMRIDGTEKNPTDAIARQCYDMLKERYTRDYSECLDLLYGIQMSVITEIGSSGSKILSAKPEPYSVLNMCIPERVSVGGVGGAAATSAPTPQRLTLYDCFDKYCESEQLDGENAWFNDATGKKQPVNKSILFWSMPEIMVIDLKRFVPTSNYGRYKKNNTHIDIPLEGASFAKYVRGYSPEKYVYDLYGVCNHHGSINGGHYTATVRVADGRWFNFNDERVSEIVPKMTHLDGGGGAPYYLDGSGPYCLFYRRRK